MPKTVENLVARSEREMRVSLSDNPIECIPEGFIQSSRGKLEALFLRNTHLQSLPKNIHTSDFLVSQCPIRKTDAIMSTLAKTDNQIMSLWVSGEISEVMNILNNLGIQKEYTVEEFLDDDRIMINKILPLE